MWLIGTLYPVPAQGGGVVEGLFYFVGLVAVFAVLGYALNLIGERKAAPASPQRHLDRAA
jgi:hypothetical protein